MNCFRILTSSNDKTAAMLSLKLGRDPTVSLSVTRSARLSGHLSTVCSVSALDSLALTGSVDKTVKLWTLAPAVKDEERMLKTFVGHYKRVRWL